MVRHPGNTNLTLHYDATYLGLPVQQDKGPFVLSYLERLTGNTTLRWKHCFLQT
jgi:hypothetical protein